MARLINNDAFRKYFPDGELGQECYRLISKYVFKYSPEIDGDGHTECDDSIILYVKDYSEPISSKIINTFFDHFKNELWRVAMLVTFCNIPVDGVVTTVKVEDIINNHKPVYHIIFDPVDLKFFDYFFNEIELTNNDN